MKEKLKNEELAMHQFLLEQLKEERDRVNNLIAQCESEILTCQGGLKQ